MTSFSWVHADLHRGKDVNCSYTPTESLSLAKYWQRNCYSFLVITCVVEKQSSVASCQLVGGPATPTALPPLLLPTGDVVAAIELGLRSFVFLWVWGCSGFRCVFGLVKGFYKFRVVKRVSVAKGTRQWDWT